MKIVFHHRIRSKDGQFVHLEEMVKAFRSEGHEVTIVGPRIVESGAFGSDGGWTDVVRAHLPSWVGESLELLYNLVALPRLLIELRRRRPDFVYERFNLFFPAGVWAARLMKVPVVLEVNAPLFEERDQQSPLKLTRVAEASQRYVWQRADLVLPVTKVLAETMISYGVDPARVMVMPNGVDLERFYPRDAEQAKNALGLSGKVVLGFVGFVRKWHGVDEIVRAMASGLLPAHSHLLIIGDGPARPDLEVLAAELGMGERVTFTGLVSREELPRYIAAFDVALQPAVTEYASPLKVIEYLAMGKSILAPDQPNIREILSDGVNARLLGDEDRGRVPGVLGDLVRDCAQRAVLEQGAKATIEQLGLTWTSNARRIAARVSQLGRELR